MILENRFSHFKKQPRLHLFLLLAWIGIGAALRFTNLDLKSPSTIELATIIFSLGNSVTTIPLDQVISLDTLLQPLKLNSTTNFHDVIHYLMTESTHPPVYFLLTHWWLKLFSSDGGLISLGVARSLAAIFGIAAIPGIYCLSLLAFRSRLTAQLTAAMMAVSPYGIYIAQEARHYTLPVLLMIASLGCWVVAARTIKRQTPLPIWVGLTWVIINSLGMAIHYFFSLVIAVEGLVLVPLLWRQLKQYQTNQTQLTKPDPASQFFLPIPPNQFRIYAVGFGSLVGGLVWLPALHQVSDSELTRWIYEGKNPLELLEPVPRLVIWMMTMLALLPVEGVPQPIMLLSGGILGIFLIAALSILIPRIIWQSRHPETRFSTRIFSGFLGGMILLFLGIIYGLGADLTLAARYQFVYFPTVILLLGVGLASCWHLQKIESMPQGVYQICVSQFSRYFRLENQSAIGNKLVFIILLMSFLGSLTVVSNLGFQKSKHPDLLIPQIVKAQSSNSVAVPVLIAMVHQTHAETRAMMGIAYEFQRFSTAQKLGKNTVLNPAPRFILAHEAKDTQTASDTLQKALSQLPKPLDLWTVNFKPSIPLKTLNCVLDSQPTLKIAGDKYRLFHCGYPR